MRNNKSSAPPTAVCCFFIISFLENLELVSDAPDGFQTPVFTDHFQLFTEPLHVDVHGAAVAEVVEAPDLVQQLVAGVDPVGRGKNRMGKTRDLFKKIRDSKGTFHAKIGSIKDRNGRDLTEAEDIKKRWQEYTEELYKKDLHDPDNHEGVITPTHLEPDILECEVKWALGSITTNKASGGNGMPVELFQILKMML